MSKNYERMYKLALHMLEFAMHTFDLEVNRLAGWHKLRTEWLLPLLTKYRKEGKISLEQQDNIIDMLNSVNREDWYIAFVLIQQLEKV